MNLWLHFWSFIRLLVIFTDFSLERNEIISRRVLAIFTNLKPHSRELTARLQAIFTNLRALFFFLLFS